MGDYVDLAALGKVLLASVAGGAGLIALYAFGIRALAAGQDQGRRGATSLATSLAVICFALVVAGVLLGLYVLLSA